MILTDTRLERRALHFSFHNDNGEPSQLSSPLLHVSNRGGEVRMLFTRLHSLMVVVAHTAKQRMRHECDLQQASTASLAGDAEDSSYPVGGENVFPRMRRIVRDWQGWRSLCLVRGTKTGVIGATPSVRCSIERSNTTMGVRGFQLL